MVCWGQGENGFPCTPHDRDCGQLIPPRETIEICAKMSLPIERSVSSGYAHSCRLKDDGRVVCWGAGVTSERCGGSECGGTDVCEEIIECGQANPPADATFA